MAEARNKDGVRELIARAELIRSNLESQAELCHRVAEITRHADGLADEWNEVGAEMNSLIQKLFPARLGGNASDAGTAAAKTSNMALPSDQPAPAGADATEETPATPPSAKTPFARRTGSFVELIAQSAKRRAA